MVLCALSIFAIVALIATELVARSQLTIAKFGIKFFFGQRWDPVNGNFGALPFIYGTLVSSFIALVIAVPLAVGVAIFLTEMCPKMLRGPLSFLTELLAAIPSVVYGFWAVFVLVPILREHVNPILIKTLRLDRPLHRAELRHRHAGRRSHPRHHDPAHHLLAHARGHVRRSPYAA